MDHARTHAHALAQQYLAAWNERDTIATTCCASAGPCTGFLDMAA